MNAAAATEGRLVLRPGAAEPIACERPMVAAGLMRRLAEGRRAALMPDLVGSVFSLCAFAQRGTSRRALSAALDLEPDPPAQREAEALALALETAREHLQRFALDLPVLLPQPGVLADPTALRDAPVFALPPVADRAALQRTAEALPGWLARRLFGCPPAEWLARWQADRAGWLAEWATAHATQRHPLARWFAAVRPRAEALVLPCRPLTLLDAPDGGAGGLRALVAALAADADFPERPCWHGEPAESGPWTRAGRGEPVTAAGGVWLRLGARLADLAALACGAGLSHGALRLADGEAIAWTEMSRGLLLHWTRLDDGPRRADTARVAAYRVFAPTEWNFHPQGALGLALAQGRLGAEDAKLAALALDPCLRFTVHADGVAAHA